MPLGTHQLHRHQRVRLDAQAAAACRAGVAIDLSIHSAVIAATKNKPRTNPATLAAPLDLAYGSGIAWRRLSQGQPSVGSEAWPGTEPVSDTPSQRGNDISLVQIRRSKLLRGACQVYVQRGQISRV